VPEEVSPLSRDSYENTFTASPEFRMKNISRKAAKTAKIRAFGSSAFSSAVLYVLVYEILSQNVILSSFGWLRIGSGEESLPCTPFTYEMLR
jgi:hypothetical protein